MDITLRVNSVSVFQTKGDSPKPLVRLAGLVDRKEIADVISFDDETARKLYDDVYAARPNLTVRMILDVPTWDALDEVVRYGTVLSVMPEVIKASKYALDGVSHLSFNASGMLVAAEGGLGVSFGTAAEIAEAAARTLAALGGGAEPAKDDEAPNQAAPEASGI